MQDTTAATLTTQQVHALVDAGAALHVDIQIDRSNDRNIIADETETLTTVRDEEHLFELLLAKVWSERPDPSNYMPVFEGEELGWCLYETVSEGTPITPVFATAEGLIDHLSTRGDDWNRAPYRREAAERLVSSGSSMGSMVAAGGRLFDGARDIDIIPQGGAS